MKNLVKKGLLIAAVCFAMVTKASDNDNFIKVTVIHTKLIDIELPNYDGDLLIRVKDAYGQVLYTENYVGSKYSKKYDLKTLPKGDYLFEIEGFTKIKLMPFTVTSDDVIFDDEVNEIYFKPTVRRDDDLVYISKIALKNESLTIVLKDEYGNILYNETMSGISNLGKKLNVKELENGSYSLLLKSDKRVFTEQIKIEK